MRLEVHRRLAELRAAVGMDYGKCVQKLLGLAFLEAGALRLTDRSIQGIDLEVTLADRRRLALEVKTTEAEAIRLGDKDLEGLEARRAEGFQPFLAALGPNRLDDWIFARVHPGELRAKESYAPLLLRAWRDRELEAVVASTFPAVVLAHAAAAAVGRQSALNALLERYPAYARA